MVKKRISNTKSRTLLIFIGVIALVIVLIVMLASRKADPLKSEQSRSAKVPKMTSIPGQVTSEKYQELQEEDNRRRAEEAKQSGGSAVATIIGTREKDPFDDESFGLEFGSCPVCDCAAPISDEVVCPADPRLAIEKVANDKEAAKRLLDRCPSLAALMAEMYPDLFKELMLENPALAKKVSDADPATMKKLMESDPDFAQKLARTSPDALKALLADDPEFAKKNAAIVKELMKTDPAFADKMFKNNPALVKEMLLDDPDFAKKMAKNNPNALKDMLKNDPEFTAKFGAQNPDIIKDFMKNDPDFAKAMFKQNPDLVKQLMKDDPDFARQMARDYPGQVKEMMDNDPDFAKALLEGNPGLNTILEAALDARGLKKQQGPSLEELHKKKQAERQKRVRQIQLNEAQQKQLAAILGNMEKQAKEATASWTEIPGQAYVQGGGNNDEEQVGGGAAGAGAGGEGGAANTGPIMLKAGTILFAVLDTSVNTDEPGPILATIAEGKFRGAKIIGDVQSVTDTSSGRPEKVTLNFSTMSPLDADQSISIQGVAVDPDTARTALATDVDHHYLLRYGTLLASSFLTGYAKVISSQGTVQTDSGTGSSTTTTPTLSGRQEIFAALGEVGKRIGEATSSYFNTPNTITVEAGTGFGLLLLSDVTG